VFRDFSHRLESAVFLENASQQLPFYSIFNKLRSFVTIDATMTFRKNLNAEQSLKLSVLSQICG
jgi:hypothetical protein